MTRPTDWYLVDLGGDPTPGESWDVRALSGAYGNIATIASEVSTIIDAVNTTSQSGIWIGQAGDTFRRVCLINGVWGPAVFISGWFSRTVRRR